jgi:hypothetical protein
MRFIVLPLRFFETLEALAFEPRFPWRGPTPRSTLPLRYGSATRARQRYGSIVRERVAIQGVRGVVDVSLEYSFVEVVEHDGFGSAAEPRPRRWVF